MHTDKKECQAPGNCIEWGAGGRGGLVRRSLLGVRAAWRADTGSHIHMQQHLDSHQGLPVEMSQVTARAEAVHKEGLQRRQPRLHLPPPPPGHCKPCERQLSTTWHRQKHSAQPCVLTLAAYTLPYEPAGGTGGGMQPAVLSCLQARPDASAASLQSIQLVRPGCSRLPQSWDARKSPCAINQRCSLPAASCGLKG